MTYVAEVKVQKSLVSRYHVTFWPVTDLSHLQNDVIDHPKHFHIILFFWTETDATNAVMERYVLKQFGKQDCIPVGCLPPACLPYPSMHCVGGSAQGECLPGRGSAQGGVCPGDVCVADPPPVNRMTDRCKNITLPQLCCGR